MIRTFCLATLLSCVAVVANVNAQFTTNQGAFMAGLAGGHYLEEFNGWSFGTPLSNVPTWDSPVVNGYGYTVSTSGGLFSVPGALSTNAQADSLIFTFTGAPVTAFGGNFYGSDFDGILVSADVTFLTNAGDSFTHTVSTMGGSFLGFYSAAPLVSVTITTAGTNWATADNVVAGSASAIPEPSTAILGLLGLIGLAANRRRSC